MQNNPEKKDRSDKLAGALHYMLDHFCRALYPIELAESKQRQTTKQASKQQRLQSLKLTVNTDCVCCFITFS